MKRISALTAVACACLCHLGCSDSPTEPAPIPPAPPADFAALLPLLDLESSALAPVAAELAAGDSLGAAEALLAHFLAKPELPCPHAAFANAEAYAEELLAGRLTLQPHATVDLPADPTWAEDPLGDVNWRYQYHTFRWAMALFQTYAQTGRQDCLDRFQFLLKDYARDNLVPAPPSPMTWYDMAASFRAENWLYQWQRSLQLGLVDVETMVTFLGWISVHGQMLAENIDYAAENNHGVFHNRSLVALGRIVPEFKASPGWLTLGATRVVDQLLSLVDADGVYREGAPFYHFYMLSTFSSATDLIADAGFVMPQAAQARLDAMPHFAAHYIKPNGELPMIGDTPRDIALAPYRGFSEELDFAVSAGAEGIAPAERMLRFPQGGYSIFRSGWGESRPFAEETQIVFDHSPLGGWHGQYDGLNIELTSDGENLVVDTGFTSFTGAWRSWFKSPEAHNVLVLADGSPPTLPDPEALVWRQGDDWGFSSAWLRMSPQRDWIRCAVYLAPDDLLLIDDSIGDNAEAVDFLLHFMPNAEATLGAAGADLHLGDAALDIRFGEQAELSLHEGEESPKQGWYAEGYGQLAAAPVLRARQEGRALHFRTLLHAHDGGDPLLGFTVLEERADLLRVEIERRSGGEVVEIRPDIGLVVRTPAAAVQAISSP